MNYAIEILKFNLKSEKEIFREHSKILREGTISKSSEKVFRISVNMAKKQIDELERAISKLK